MMADEVQRSNPELLEAVLWDLRLQLKAAKKVAKHLQAAYQHHDRANQTAWRSSTADADSGRLHGLVTHAEVNVRHLERVVTGETQYHGNVAAMMSATEAANLVSAHQEYLVGKSSS